MRFKFLATGIGSMPFVDPDYAAGVSLSRLPEAPFWPQLPRRDLNEQMEVQFSEGMPCVVVDRERSRMYFDTAGDYSEAFASFYESYVAAMDPDEGNGDCSAMAISSSFSRGIPALLERLRPLSSPLPFVKVQTTGPCSFALTVVDENKRALYYNDDFRDMIVKALAMKCRWQIQTFRPFAEQVICFVDEPILSAFGSSTYVSVKREDVVSILAEMVEAIHADSGLAGIHCCGNTDWSIPVEAGLDIVNFDAFEFGETVDIYPDAIKAHLERGGVLAWGVVPTSPEIRTQTVEALASRIEILVDRLADRGIERRRIIEQAMVTPSCGTGALAPEDAEKVFEMTGTLSAVLRDRHGC